MPGCTGTPSILSACLVSTEPEPYLRMFPGFASTDAYSKKSRSAGPDDTTVTHIMVFPTSADIQLGAADQHAAGDDDWDMDLVDMDIPQDGNDLGDDFLSSLCMDTGPPQPSASFRTAGNSFFSENTAGTDPNPFEMCQWKTNRWQLVITYPLHLQLMCQTGFGRAVQAQRIEHQFI
ncbi:unnamed protein product [Strongylus vulgaris]|uniref:Mediator of RNA polymerase II transcription subunit 13 n=1 Tax=Strongylus vulgaris TaxID=40348 RepID=A0A3P7KMP9_STRVU|nr:unnamed protein product [Strongylus vulgaris]